MEFKDRNPDFFLSGGTHATDDHFKFLMYKHSEKGEGAYIAPGGF